MGRLQSVAVMTESLRLDVSSIKRDIEIHNGTVDRLHQRAIADRTERDGMITTLNGTIAQQGVTVTQQGLTIALQGVKITELNRTVDYLKGREIANKI